MLPDLSNDVMQLITIAGVAIMITQLIYQFAFFLIDMAGIFDDFSYWD